MSDHELDLPFEEVPGGPVEMPLDPTAVICGGLIIRSSLIFTPDGPLPALTFDFHHVSGAKVAPIVLTSDDPEQLRKLIPLVTASVESAIAAATR